MPTTFREAALPNGLRVIAEVDPEAHSAACGFFVKTGARDEPGALMGVSHFLEHMMFKGTEDLSADDINRGFDAIGARNNAYTSHEMTCFHAQSLPDALPAALDLLARMMRPALRTEDFDREKQVILEEIAMYKDDPFWVLFEEALARHYGAHPLGHRVLGTNETIAALPRDAMRLYFDERYSPDNTVVALSGRVDFGACVDRIARLCGSWTPTRVGRDTGRPRVGGGEFTLRDAKVTRGYLFGLAPAPAVDDDRRYAAMLLAQVLGASDNSRLHWSLIETGLAEEAQAGYDPRDGDGDFYVFAAGEPGRMDEIWGAVLKEIDGLVASLVAGDLEKLRPKLATSVALGAERPADGMQRIGRLWTYLGRYTTLDEELTRINRVTLDDLRGVAAAFPLRPVTAGRLLPA
ncbi:MAG: M16 family metallopeptidase [Phycisphaerales bacterium]